jgi:hypothetical protein
MVAKVSPEDEALARSRKWYAGTVSRTNTYAMRTERRDGRKGAVYLHRLILGAGAGQLVDHINGDTLDNRRENLRFATPQQNCVNRTDYAPASGFRGVSRAGRKWRAIITVRQEVISGGNFATAEEAARWYDGQAAKHFGEFAVLNFPRAARA